MEPQRPYNPNCRREGCTFERERYKDTSGRFKLGRYCSRVCSVWVKRAKEAVDTNNEAEAAELLRLQPAMDARSSSYQSVPGVVIPLEFRTR